MNSNEHEDGPALPAAAIVAINQGRMIEAIRIVRESVPGLGLKEARDLVEDYAGRDPMLKAQLEQRRAEARRKLIKTFLIIDLLLVAGILWYFFGR
jgi:ribosomal protein L7/L12